MTLIEFLDKHFFGLGFLLIAGMIFLYSISDLLMISILEDLEKKKETYK